jgi:hypothetical protein
LLSCSLNEGVIEAIRSRNGLLASPVNPARTR